MESVGAYEAKTRLAELLDRVARGEEIRITRNGRRSPGLYRKLPIRLLTFGP